MSVAVVATDFGGPEVLSVVERPIPQPGLGEVLVRVHAVGVNPIDHKSYSGAFGTDRSQLPKPLGSEAAGVVEAIGEGVTGVAAGDEVIAYRAPGAYAEHLVVGLDALTPKAPGTPWTEAAGLLLTGVTAVHALTVTDVGPGDVVLVHGAAGGVGLMAVQLARHYGARVIGTASARNHDVLRDFGVTPVEYGTGLAERVRDAAPDGVTAALDLIGSDEAVDVSLALVELRNRIVSIAAFGRASDGIQLIGGGPGADAGTELRNAAREPLARALGDGSLRVLIARTFPLADAAVAHRLSRDGHVTGKLVLTV